MSGCGKTQTVPHEEIERQRDFCQKAEVLLKERFGRDPVAFVHSYGCQQNVSDGERIKGMLAEMGFCFAAEPDDADLVLFNTCAVRGHAEDRVFGNVGAMKALKRRRPQAIIGLCGCMVQQEHVAEKIRASYPYVNLLFGTHAIHRLPELIYELITKNRRVFERPESDGFIAEDIPVRRDGSFKGWLPIMYGCNNFCTYCIVPYVRGREKSRPFEEIVDEVTGLVRQGVREITLLGQNVNSYGRDLFGKPRFADLLRAVGDTGVERIFFTSSHPKDLLPETIDAMAETPAVMPQLHLAVQSGSTRILKEMNRRYTREDYLGLVDRIRNRMPDIALSTDIIVGFPGETEEDFEQTLSLAETVRYAQAYTFIYSKRAGTPAAEIDDPTPHEVILERFNRLVKVIETTAHEYNQGELHTVVPALIEGASKKNDAVLLGKSPKNQTVHAPIPEGYSIDQLIGKIVDVDVDVAKTWYLSGSVVGEPR